MNGIVTFGRSWIHRACWQQAKAEVMAANADLPRLRGWVPRLIRLLRLRREIRRRAKALRPIVSRRALF